jgi:hypothetical protein
MLTPGRNWRSPPAVWRRNEPSTAVATTLRESTSIGAGLQSPWWATGFGATVVTVVSTGLTSSAGESDAPAVLEASDPMSTAEHAVNVAAIRKIPHLFIAVESTEGNWS